jgi:hypothetical protein
MYVPDGYAHGVINLAEGVGYVLGFDLTVKTMRPWNDKGDSAAAGDGAGGAGATGAGAGDGAGVGEMTEAALMTKRIKVLRQMLKQVGVGCEGCAEKSDYVKQILAVPASAWGSNKGKGKDEL